MTTEADGIVLKGDAVKIKGLKRALLAAFTGIAQTSMAFYTGKLSFGVGALASFFKAAGEISFNDNKERLVYLLIAGALARSLELVLAKLSFARKPTKQEYNALANTMLERLGQGDIVINRDFLSHPDQFPFLDKFATDVCRHLDGLLFEKDKANMARALRGVFAEALDQTWMSDPEAFEVLQTALNTPFSEARKREQERQRYLSHIQKQFDEEPLIGQPRENPVLLSDVFVPLRAYWSTSEETDKPEQADRDRGATRLKTEKDLVEFSDDILSWIKNSPIGDEIRVVSAGPGIGKSCSLKAIASQLARSGSAFPVFLQLQHFPSGSELSVAIADELKRIDAHRLSDSPVGDHMQEYCRNGPLVLFFDGLDEIVVAGADGDRMTRDFVRDVKSLVDNKNSGQSKPRVLTIISGRVASADKAVSQLKIKGNQLLHLLPFFIDAGDRSGYKDDIDGDRLCEDQREVWWHRWQQKVAPAPQQMPPELTSEKFSDVSKEPLLFYFLALAEAWKPTEGKEVPSRNVVYQRVLEKFHQRELDKNIRNFADGFSDYHKQFEPALQGLAMAAWVGGTSRVGHMDDVTRFLTKWDPVLAGNFSSVVGNRDRSFGASLAFHLRESEGHETFEFLHKSFSEFLVARRFVSELTMSTKTFDLIEQSGGQITKSSILHTWLWHWGARNIDADLLQFIREEVKNRVEIGELDAGIAADTFADLFRYQIDKGMPASEMRGQQRANAKVEFFADMVDWARNGEEALLVALNAVRWFEDGESSPTSIVSEGRSRSAAGDMLHRLLRQRERGYITHHCLSGLNFEQVNLRGIDLLDANLGSANFAGANLTNADLTAANLAGANLAEANLGWADLSDADLTNVDLTRATLLAATLAGADLAGANLTEANLGNTDLTQADLTGANLTGARLTDSLFVAECYGIHRSIRFWIRQNCRRAGLCLGTRKKIAGILRLRRVRMLIRANARNNARKMGFLDHPCFAFSAAAFKNQRIWFCSSNGYWSRVMLKFSSPCIAINDGGDTAKTRMLLST